MKTYKVLASYTVYCSMDIEAEDEAQAWNKAKFADGGDFSTDEYGDWSIDSVKEVTE